MQIPQEQKVLLTWNKKHFSSFLKYLKHIKIIETNKKNFSGKWEFDFKHTKLWMFKFDYAVTEEKTFQEDF